MLLFVLAALTIFHFALPRGSEPRGRARPALDRAHLHRAARAHARVRRRARAGDVRRARPRAVRPQRDLAREVARGVRLPRRAPSSSRCRPSRPSSRAIDGRTVAAVALANIGICAVGTLIGAMAVAGRARELLLPLLFLPLAIPIVVGGVGASYLLVPRCSTTRSSRCSPGRRSSTSSPRPEPLPDYDADAVKTHSAALPAALAGVSDRSVRPRDRADLLLRADRRRPGLLAADLLLPRPDRAHLVRLLRLGRVEGAAPPLEARRAAPTSRATSRSTRA